MRGYEESEDPISFNTDCRETQSGTVAGSKQIDLLTICAQHVVTKTPPLLLLWVQGRNRAVHV